MKKELTKWSKVTEEVSLEDTVNDFFDGDWDPRDWDETKSCLDAYIDEEFEEISNKEAALLSEEIKKEFDKRVSELKQEEIDQLKDRKSILDLLDYYLCSGFPNMGEVGFLLSNEEILDLILQNGNK